MSPNPTDSPNSYTPFPWIFGGNRDRGDVLWEKMENAQPSVVTLDAETSGRSEVFATGNSGGSTCTEKQKHVQAQKI